MADLYLYLDNHKANFLTWFGREKGHFLVALGADGAPFGKANEACAWLVCFLNVQEKSVASPDDNFLLCGANCKEDHPSMLVYGRMLKSQITEIESQSFIVRDQLVKYEFKLVPSDMKWLAKFSGGLSNAAKYPCSFANVLLSELNERGGSLGNDPYNKWKPWSYTFRVEVARKVESVKKLWKKTYEFISKTNITYKDMCCRSICSLGKFVSN